MLELAKIIDYLKYLKKVNKAFDDVGWNGQMIPISVERKYAVIVGDSASKIANHLLIADKITGYYEIKTEKDKTRAYAVEFKE